MQDARQGRSCFPNQHHLVSGKLGRCRLSLAASSTKVALCLFKDGAMFLLTFLLTFFPTFFWGKFFDIFFRV